MGFPIGFILTMKICIIAVNKITGEKKWYDGDSCWVDFVLDIL
jgi:hypothetical protein